MESSPSSLSAKTPFHLRIDVADHDKGPLLSALVSEGHEFQIGDVLYRATSNPARPFVMVRHLTDNNNHATAFLAGMTVLVNTVEVVYRIAMVDTDGTVRDTCAVSKAGKADKAGKTGKADKADKPGSSPIKTLSASSTARSSTPNPPAYFFVAF